MDKTLDAIKAKAAKTVERAQAKRDQAAGKPQFSEPKTKLQHKELTEKLTGFIRDTLHLPNAQTAIAMATGSSVPGAKKAEKEVCAKEHEPKPSKKPRCRKVCDAYHYEYT